MSLVVVNAKYHYKSCYYLYKLYSTDSPITILLTVTESKINFVWVWDICRQQTADYYSTIRSNRLEVPIAFNKTLIPGPLTLPADLPNWAPLKFIGKNGETKNNGSCVVYEPLDRYVGRHLDRHICQELVQWVNKTQHNGGHENTSFFTKQYRWQWWARVTGSPILILP